MVGRRDRITHTHIAHILQATRDEADLAVIEPSQIDRLWPEAAHIRDLELLAGGHHLQLHAFLYMALFDADVRDDALIRVKIRIEYQSPQRCIPLALRGRYVVDDRREDIIDALPRLR